VRKGENTLNSLVLCGTDTGYILFIVKNDPLKFIDIKKQLSDKESININALDINECSRYFIVGSEEG